MCASRMWRGRFTSRRRRHRCGNRFGGLSRVVRRRRNSVGKPEKAHIMAREPLVCAGLPIAESIFRALDREMRIGFLHEDGSFVESGAELLEIAGEAQAILTGERTALNFLAHLCGIATLTRRFVGQVAGAR